MKGNGRPLSFLTVQVFARLWARTVGALAGLIALARVLQETFGMDLPGRVALANGSVPFSRVPPKGWCSFWFPFDTTKRVSSKQTDI